MTEDLGMGQGNPSNIPDMNPDLFQSSTPAYHVADDPADGSEHSLNDSGPSTPIHDDEGDEDIDTTSPLILRPYAIEEPSDESISAHPRPELPSLPDYFERWQRELKDSVNDLGSEPNRSTCNARLSSTPRRGQKRKVAQPAGAIHHPPTSSTPSKNKDRLNEPGITVPGLSPKRRRRRSRIAADAGKSTRTASLDEFRETQASDSSSSDQPMTDISVDTTPETNLTDEMDID